MSVADNLKHILSTIPPNVKLVAISKTKPLEVVMEAYQAGQRTFGENKVQEMAAKQEEMPKDIRWHMVGHLQSNKVKFIVPFVSLIHSVDSQKLLAVIDKEAAKVNRVVDCLLQVHIATEDTKFGFDRNELLSLVNSGALGGYSHVRVCGLMGMATYTENQEQVRGEFGGLKRLFEEMKPLFGMHFTQLSMGMSGDYILAIEAGSTLVRVGSSIFGERNYAI
ncbi:MAG TPA: YggS family pyridoxal phosphate-dependent enzyme [Williamwhitmania sp.]|nr:YggS family pyridoxal phosphate-dependent enzyme [Williamwhitmania sp.]